MTSPGGNEVVIVVRSKDETGPALASVEQKQRKLRGELEQTGKAATGFGSTLKRVGEVAGGVLAADMLIAGAQKLRSIFHSTIESASSLNESVNAVNKIFGTASATVIKWGQDNANAIGLSTRAFNQMATPLGSMLKNQGLNLEQVTQHTIRLTERAADMASVFNTDVTDALVAIQAGLRGEQDPLERYGVSLSAVAVEARALADTHKTSTAALTANEKAVARLNLIYEQTADTAGDFRGTADGLANSQRIATAAIEEAKAKIGSAFLPVMAKAAQVQGQFATSLANIPTGVVTVVAAVVGLSAAVLLLAPRIKATSVALNEMRTSASLGQRGLANLAVGAAKAGGALGVLAVANMALGSTFEKQLNPQIDAATDSLRKWNGTAKLTGEGARIFGENAEDLKKSLTILNADGFQKAILGLDSFAAALDPFHQASIDIAKEKVGAFDSALAQLVRNGNADVAAQNVKTLGISADQVKELLPEYSGAMQTAANKTENVGDAAADAVTSLDDLADEIHGIIDDQFAYQNALDAVADTVADLTKQVQDQKKAHEDGAGSLEGNTEAARRNREGAQKLVEKYADLIIEAQKAGKSTNDLREDLIKQLTQIFGNRDAAEKYAASLLTLKARLDAIQSKEVTLRMNIEQNRTFGGGFREFAHGGIQGAAGGGPRGNSVLVGEHGPELVDLAPGSMVHSNPDTRRMLNGSGGVARVELVISSGGSAVDEFLVQLLSRAISVKGGDGAVIGIRTVRG